MTRNSGDRMLTIDTHHHILPDFFWEETENANAPIGGLAPLRWSEEASISFMDDAGIDLAVMSVSTPGVHTGDNVKARDLARRCNEFLADLVRKRPDRFGGFACLPLPDVDGALEELSYALDVLGLDGIVLFTNSNGVYLGDPALEPVFEELERRRVIVFVHPNPSPDAIAHTLGLPDNVIDFPTDTNRAVAQMHYTNRFARTPNVKYIFSHAGGSIPYLATRFAVVDEMGFVPGSEERGEAFETLRRMHWDTALSVSDPVFRMLRDVSGLGQVLFGTDFPYFRRDLAVGAKERILRCSELNDSEGSAILGGNAARLFPRLDSGLLIGRTRSEKSSAGTSQKCPRPAPISEFSH
jgi:6-methylsalicylate decarboxylase